MIPDEKFYESLGRPPWSHESILSELRTRGVTRIMPTDQQAFSKNSEFDLDTGVGIVGKIRDAGIELDLGDGESLC